MPGVAPPSTEKKLVELMAQPPQAEDRSVPAVDQKKTQLLPPTSPRAALAHIYAMLPADVVVNMPEVKRRSLERACDRRRPRRLAAAVARRHLHPRRRAAPGANLAASTASPRARAP